MITPDYIKGYLAALRTVETGINGLKESIIEGEYQRGEETNAQEACDIMIDFVKDQREGYKEIVDKLNTKLAKDVVFDGSKK